MADSNNRPRPKQQWPRSQPKQAIAPKVPRRLDLPFFSVFELAPGVNGRLIRTYRAYIDAHELFLKN